MMIQRVTVLPDWKPVRAEMRHLVHTYFFRRRWEGPAKG